MSDGNSTYRANIQRGELLRNQGRFAEAETYLQQAIAEQPSTAQAYYELAFCYCNWSGHAKKALATVDRAISLEPNRAGFLSLRAWILGNLNKNKEAIQVANQALALSPHNILALNAQTRAYIDLCDWKQAENNARRTLEINPTNELAGNFLAVSLRGQGRLQESETVTAGLLAQVPDSAMAQSNAGWSALRMGDHQLANEHFLEALRLKPNYEYARKGLLHSFNSRVWLYRIYFQFISWVARFGKVSRFLPVFVFVILQGVAKGPVNDPRYHGPYSILGVVAIFFLLFVTGRSFGNLFLLLDPFARHALTPKEKRRSIVVGLFFGFILTSEVIAGAWLQVSILTAVLLLFLFPVLRPRLQNPASGSKTEISEEL